MKVSELITELKNFPEEMEVTLSQDEEGNNIHFLSEIMKCKAWITSLSYTDPAGQEVSYKEIEGLVDFREEEDWQPEIVVLWP